MNRTKLTELQSYLQANSISAAYLSNPTTIAYSVAALKATRMNEF